MPATLRIDQHPGAAAGRHRIEIEAEGPDRMHQSASLDLDFALMAQEQERIRWYLEDYLEYPHDPAPKIASDIEREMAAIGRRLAEGIFRGSEAARDVWNAFEQHLGGARIEIATGAAEATAIPWELLADPRDGRPLALTARSFVRVPRGAATALPPQGAAGKVRILLVICRPGGRDDVPFRSVASLLARRLNNDARDAFDLNVLRPPTWERLCRVLRSASERGQPYHVVHFDGHGTYGDLGTGGRKRGYIFLEGSAVHGAIFGDLLSRTQVHLLVLNACQSAYAVSLARPEEHVSDGGVSRVETTYGSFAQEVIDAGAAGVVAMRCKVYVVTAAQFVAELYAALAAGRTLGEAVAHARKHLHDQPERHVGQEPRALQDWSVPVAWERAGLRLWPERQAEAPAAIGLGAGGGEAADVDRALPRTPDVGFFGRDETLLALDRAFDGHSIVLLHAYAGAGKTATAAEFARWYRLTGGVDGPVIFSRFERHLPLPRLLDQIGEVFAERLERAGVQWQAIVDEDQRCDVALQILRQVPVLWVWDNVEPVTGFPAGTESAWSKEEQDQLLDFLRDLRETKAKVLLTSRREERAWLGNLPARIRMPPMPLRERVAFAGAITARHGRCLADLPDIARLLEFTRGNPLTILVAVAEAMRADFRTKDQLEAYVAKLRAGEPAFDDEASEGRDRSLGASLAYGFETAFSEGERRVLALLHLFQGFVNVDALCWMGDPDAEWCLEAVRGLTTEQGIALLDRAAEVGLLTPNGVGYYGIHPALPWHFRALFNEHYREAKDGGSPAFGARRAFVEALGALGDYYYERYASGNRGVLDALAAEEDNLLTAWRLARASGWWKRVTSAMQGLWTLYDSTGRRSAGRRLVDAVVPELVDPDNNGPLPGREDEWILITECRVSIARQDRRRPEAERLQILLVEWARARAADALAMPSERWSSGESNRIRTLAAAAHELGVIRRERGDAACVEAYGESLGLGERTGDRAAQAASAFNLGHAFKDLPPIRDLDEAERWYRKSLELHEPGDGLGRARCLCSLGSVALRRFDEARARERPEAELLGHLNAALKLYSDAFARLPETAVPELAVTHHQIGMIYGNAGDIKRALPHYRRAIGYEEQQGNLHGAGDTRRNAAVVLAAAGRLPEALAYAEAALANFRIYGDRAAADIEETQRLISEIHRAMQQGGPS